MIHLQNQIISSLDDVRIFLQKAIELEHSTIPPYLTAYYSLHGNINADIRAALREVAIEEMLHMTLAANVLNAVGGTPRINFEEFIPQYPSTLPLGIGAGDPDKQLIVPLEPFSKQLLKNVFMEIEEPEHPRAFPVLETASLEAAVTAEFPFSTIGEFYAALKGALAQLGEGIFTGEPGDQVDIHDAFGGYVDQSRVPAIVDGLAAALRAIDVIVEQGEGTEESPLDPNSGIRGDFAHYYKFAAIYHGRELRQDPTTTQGFSYTGKRIGFNPDEVYPMIANLKLADLKPGSAEHTILARFNMVYTRMLTELDGAFSGSPGRIVDALRTMREDFQREAERLVTTVINPESLVNLVIDPCAKYHLTPSFEYVEPGAAGKTRFDRVVEILDESVGGATANVGVHGAFWRGVTRDDLVSLRVRNLDLITLGDGAGSNLVKALKGEAPFGADLPTPPAGARFSRMPPGLETVPLQDIAFIEKWIDEGSLEDPFEEERAEMVWRPTNAPVASSRTDDIWFNDPDTGWAANSDGTIVHTEDGGDTWAIQLQDPEVYFRSLGFADESRGWAGTLTSNKRLFMTDDGGENWSPIGNLPDLAPSAICGISVVSRDVVYASGTNFPNRPARVVKTIDGGANWAAIDMEPWADLLIDCFFTSATRGWVVGGKLTSAQQVRDNVKPVVLFTDDGGATWDNRLASIADDLALGEWGWKIQFISDAIGFVSLEAFDVGAILKTVDGGATWVRLPINDPQQNANLEGVGFIDANHGWVGGWGDRQFQRQSSSETLDGGLTWRDANEIGRAINRFRFFGDPVTVGYASGVTVYKYGPAPEAPALEAVAFSVLESQNVMAAKFMARTATASRVHIPVQIGESNRDLVLRIWDRFGEKITELKDVTEDLQSIEWDLKDSNGNPVAPGHYILRITSDGRSESSILHVKETAGGENETASDGAI